MNSNPEILIRETNDANTKYVIHFMDKAFFAIHIECYNDGLVLKSDVEKIDDVDYVFNAFGAKRKSNFFPISFLKTKKYGIIFLYGVVHSNESDNVLLCRQNYKWITLKESELDGEYLDISDKKKIICVDKENNSYSFDMPLKQVVIDNVQTPILDLNSCVTFSNLGGTSISMSYFINTLSVFDMDSYSSLHEISALENTSML